MKKLRFMLIASLCVLITLLTNIIISNSDGFNSDHITLENNVEMTKEKLYPVINIKNNTNSDLKVGYTFYVHESDYANAQGNILVKANQTAMLELPQLHHLGDTQESINIVFSCMEINVRKPLQNEIQTSIFSNPVKKTEPQLGLNLSYIQSNKGFFYT